MDSRYEALLVETAQEQGEEAIPLKGEIQLEDGSQGRPLLCRTRSGLWLLALSDSGARLAIDLLAGPALRYEERRLGDRLRAADYSLDIPFGNGDKVKKAIALARLSRGRGLASAAFDWNGRFLDLEEELEKHWLNVNLRDEEVLLAWLPVHSEVSIDSPLIGELKARRCFMLSSERLALVAVAELGDVDYLELAPAALAIESRLGRDTVRCGDSEWQAGLKNEDLFAELSAATAMTAPDRLGRIATLNWIKPDKRGHNRSAARRLLAILVDRYDRPLDELMLRYADHLLLAGADAPEAALPSDELHSPLRRIAATDAGAELACWADDWQLSNAVMIELVEALLGFDELPALAAALPLHRLARDRRLQEEKDLLGQALTDILFARHLIAMDRHAEALPLLEERLQHLPDEKLADLLPAPTADLTTGAGGQSLRIAILDLLVTARGNPEVADAATVQTLAMLQPLLRARIEALRHCAAAELADRAARVLQLFDGVGPLAESEGQESSQGITALDAELLNNAVQHPASRKGAPLEQLTTWIGKARVPDHSAIRAHGERVSSRKHPSVMAIITDTVLGLSLPAVEAYISHGEKGIGLRAYEGDPPFMLIGAVHLDEESEYFMSSAELRFAIGHELAHLKFQHTRLTSQEVWDGVFDKSSSLLESVMMLAGPLSIAGKTIAGLSLFNKTAMLQRVGTAITSINIGDKAGKMAEWISISRDVQQSSRAARTKDTAPATDDIDTRPDDLLAACRVMQLTADRVGLLLCGDVAAAIRAIFLSNRGYCALLPVAERHGITTALNRHGDDGRLLNQDLAIRAAALISFYLSDDYVAARRALTTI